MGGIHVEYTGDLHCKAVHGPSGSVITTDAPKDNHGKGEDFSPTDLVAAALGACILSVMGLRARSLNIDISGATASVEKEMANHPVRRIQKLGVIVRMPRQLDSNAREQLEAAAQTCPIHKSMHPDVQMPIEFVWG